MNRKTATAACITLVYISILVSCSLAPAETAPLEEFILGPWHGQTWHINGAIVENVDYQLEFIAPDILIFNREPSNILRNGISRVYNQMYKYRFISPDHLAVKLDREYEILLDRSGSQLAITSELVEGKVLFLARMPNMNWPILSIGFGIIVTGILIWAIKITKARLVQSSGDTLYTPSDTWTPGKKWQLVFILISVILFVLGVKLGQILWHASYWRLIHLPWDAVISLEIGILITGLAAVIFLRDRITQKEAGILLAGFWYQVGILLIGLSGYGIFISLYRIGIFYAIGTYPEF